MTTKKPTHSEKRIYNCSGPDSMSDNNYFEIIIEAQNTTQARKYANAHLKETERNLQINRITLLKDKPIIHSTVQVLRKYTH